MMTGWVFDIKRYSIHDGPGIRTTVFLKGCALRCLWCHNPESIHPGPELMHWPARCVRCHACVKACPTGALSTDASGAVVVDRAKCDLCGKCAEACLYDAMQIVGREMTRRGRPGRGRKGPGLLRAVGRRRHPLRRRPVRPGRFRRGAPRRPPFPGHPHRARHGRRCPRTASLERLARQGRSRPLRPQVHRRRPAPGIHRRLERADPRQPGAPGRGRAGDLGPHPARRRGQRRRRQHPANDRLSRSLSRRSGGSACCPTTRAGSTRPEGSARSRTSGDSTAPSEERIAAIEAAFRQAGFRGPARRMTMNERIAKLRTQTLEAKPTISAERARLITEFYKRPETRRPVGADAARPGFQAHHGERRPSSSTTASSSSASAGPAPKATPTYPEVCIHSLQDLRIPQRPEEDRLRVRRRDAPRSTPKEIIPFWQGRSQRDRIFAEMTKEWIDAYEAGDLHRVHGAARPRPHRPRRQDLPEGHARFHGGHRRGAGRARFHDRPGRLRQAGRAQGHGRELPTPSSRSPAATPTRPGSWPQGRRTRPAGRSSSGSPRSATGSRPTRRAISGRPSRPTGSSTSGVITEYNTWDSFNPGRLDQHLWPFYEKGLADGTPDEGIAPGSCSRPSGSSSTTSPPRPRSASRPRRAAPTPTSP